MKPFFLFLFLVLIPSDCLIHHNYFALRSYKFPTLKSFAQSTIFLGSSVGHCRIQVGRRNCCGVLSLRQIGISSFDNLEGSVLKRGPRVVGVEPTKKLEYTKSGEALFEAVKDSDTDLVKQLCTIGVNGVKADPNYSDEFGFSCLHLASKVTVKRTMLQIQRLIKYNREEIWNWSRL